MLYRSRVQRQGLWSLDSGEWARCHCDPSALKDFPRVSYLHHHQHQFRCLWNKKSRPEHKDSTSLHPYLEVSLSQIKDQGHSHSPLPVSIISLLQSQPIPSHSTRRIQSYLEFSAVTAIDVLWYSLLRLRGFSVDPCLRLLLLHSTVQLRTPFSLDHCPPVPTLPLFLM